MAVYSYLGNSTMLGILAGIVPLYLFWDYIELGIQKVLARIFMPVRHKDGHMMPGAPIKLKSYFNDVNIFGREWSHRLGKMYYLWHGLTPVVIIADVDAIRNFYKDHFSHNRSEDFVFLGQKFRETMGQCVGCAHGRERVNEYRRYFEPYFTTKSANALHFTISQSGDEWISSLNIDQPIDFEASGITDIPIKILTALCYGEDVSERHNTRMKQFIHEYIQATSKRGAMFKHIAGRTSPEVSHFNKQWLDFHHMLLSERQSHPEKQGEGLYFTLQEQIDSGLSTLTETELLQTICEIWLLNLDILWTALTLLFYDLARHPHIQAKVQGELDVVLTKIKPGTITEHGESRGNAVDPALFDDLPNDLPYLHKVMKESARLNPGVPITNAERTVKEVTEMAGYLIPKHTVICVDTYTLNYDSEHWPDPETFDPERFNIEPAPYTYFRYGLGPRKCLGHRLATSIIAITAAKILHRFNVELTHPGSQLGIQVFGLPVLPLYKVPPLIFKERTMGK